MLSMDYKIFSMLEKSSYINEIIKTIWQSENVDEIWTQLSNSKIF
jgi:hypothetical protein